MRVGQRHPRVDEAVPVHDRRDELVTHALTLASVSLEVGGHCAVFGGSGADRTLVAAVVGARRERDGWVVHRPGPVDVHAVLLDVLALMRQRFELLEGGHAAIGAPVLLVVDPVEGLLNQGCPSLGSEGEKDLELVAGIAATGRAVKVHVLVTAERPRRCTQAGALRDVFRSVPSQLWLDDGEAPMRILHDAYPCWAP